jgi:hypothetical protein
MLQARSCLLREPRNLEYVMEQEHLDEIRVRGKRLGIPS